MALHGMTVLAYFPFMLRYGSTYRSPFNGPRWGAVLAVIVILFGQAASAFHDPALSREHPGTVDNCGEYSHDDSGHERCGSAEVEICCSGDRDDPHGSLEDGGCEDCSDCGDCDQDCTNCCHHIPMSSPLPTLHASLLHGAFALALPAHPFILAADTTPPFHPPRG